MVTTLRLTLILAIVALLVLGPLYILGVFSVETVQGAAEKTAWILGIFAAGSLGITLIAGTRNPENLPARKPGQ